MKATVGNEQLFGVANIGNKPTFNGTRALLEVHLFNFAQDIYGQFMHVELVKKLRDEKKFETLTQLTAQIADDVTAAKQCFGLN